MGHRSWALGLAASVATGIGLWFTRASLDVFTGPGGETRVAMLPSWPEIAGLSALVALVLLFGAWGLRRTGPGWRPFPPDLLFPLFAALLLVLPYLPVLPDAVPALRLLAGPLRVVIWVLVIGHVLWAAWDLLSSRQMLTWRSARGQAMAVFAAGVLVLGSLAYRVANGPVYPGGDELHYLVMMQSLVQDGDLRIADDQAELAGQLPIPGEPDYRARGRDGEIYSIHPIGLPLAAAPVWAAAGYPGVVALLVLVAAFAGALLWSSARRLTDSAGAATTAWLATTLSLSFVALSFAVYPEVLAACAGVGAVLWRAADDRAPASSWLVRGMAAAALPWLSTKYAPMSLVIVAVLALRAGRDRRAVSLSVAPWMASVLGWFAFFWWTWGSPSPTDPSGPSHDTSLANALGGVPALWLDQEYGALVHAPALALGFAGLVLMWRQRGRARRLAVEIAAVLGALVLTVGAHSMWWGGSAPPGRQVVAGLLLLGVPVAWWMRAIERSPARVAAARSLVLAGVAITGAALLPYDGLLLANDRDGTSTLLLWLGPAGELARALPSFIAHRAAPATLLVQLACWAALLLAGAALVRRLRTRTAGPAALAVLLAGAAAGLAGLSLAPALAGGSGIEHVPEARASVPLLDRFDARRRPIAIVYDPFRRTEPDLVPALFALEGRPGLRHDPQPLRVLLNTRLALPAGSYEVQVQPRTGEPLRGAVGLQVGRVGPPVATWEVAEPAGSSWTQPFALHVDASFVGLRASPGFEAHVAGLTVRPVHVVNASDRREVPPVLAAARFGDAAVYFHGDAVYPERNGFWVRGSSTLAATFVLPPAEHDRELRLRMHSGARPNQVRFEARLWRSAVELQPGVLQDVVIPVRPGQRVLPLQITTASGFVPGDLDGGGDRRRLGCWIEVLP